MGRLWRGCQDSGRSGLGQGIARDAIVVQTVGEVLDGAREYARRQIAAFARRLREPLTSARLKLTVLTRPSVPWPALVQANLVLDGQPIRAQVAARFVQEASRYLRARLGAQVARLASPNVPRAWPAEGGSRIVPVPRPVGQREIARCKCHPLEECTPDRAALVMDVMDYDFHLFVDAETGQDSVIYRVGPTGYRLARVSRVAPPSAPTSVPLTINVHPVPELTPEQAVQRLDATELPFRFFRDTATGRGAVLYRRYDGHYGLIAPERDGG